MKFILAIGIVIGLAGGFVIAHNTNNKAFAETANIVDQPTLEGLYKAAFGRPLDDEAGFHIGRDLNMVLRDINNSPEKRYYSALFKAVKSYEEAIRAPGQISAEDKARYLETIDSALAILIAWVETLPERPICDGIVRPEEAKEAILEAYQGMASNTARVAADKGVFGSGGGGHVGAPSSLRLPDSRCFATPKPRPTCLIRPACLDASPRCLFPEPASGGWCQRPLPTPPVAVH
ncbi:MAG: hypothetical protein Q8Q89_02175 [bacterium]|nr:hypothetical protein [bacterium]